MPIHDYKMTILPLREENKKNIMIMALTKAK